MTRRDDDPQPGLRAKHDDGVCPRCSRVINVGDRVARDRGAPVHVECVAAVDE